MARRKKPCKESHRLELLFLVASELIRRLAGFDAAIDPGSLFSLLRIARCMLPPPGQRLPLLRALAVVLVLGLAPPTPSEVSSELLAAPPPERRDFLGNA